MKFVAALILSLLSVYINGEPTGAPEDACGDMLPQHETDPQTTEPPYTLSAVSQGDGTYLVSIMAEPDNFIRGFFTQARKPEGTLHGIFSLVEEGDSEEIKARPCPEVDGVPNGMTHTQNSNKTQVAVIWDGSGEDDISDITIQATVVASHGIFWAGLMAPLV